MLSVRGCLCASVAAAALLATPLSPDQPLHRQPSSGRRAAFLYFPRLVNQAEECFLPRAVLLQLDLDLHGQGLRLVHAFEGWNCRF